MSNEFHRYGLARFRVFTGILQIAGSMGLILGFFVPYFTILASAGLATLMFLGVLVRCFIRDPLVAIFPAFFFCCLNAFIFWYSV
jgi:hypothetical protein